MKKKVIVDEKTGFIKEIIYFQDIRDILLHNEFQRRFSDENWKKDKDIKYLGRIPLTEYYKMQNLGITEDEKAFKEALKMNKQFLATDKKI